MGQKSSQRLVAERLFYIGRLARGHEKVAGLTPAQWAVLRYFSSSNRFSRTASAFANFHGTTRGTASQTIKSLVAGGHLMRVRSERDGRSARLDLTQKGWVMLAQDPFRALVDAIDRLQMSLADIFGRVLERVMFDVAHTRAAPTFGTCGQCCHLGHDVTVGAQTYTYYCHSARELLAAEELNALCVHSEPSQK